MKQIISNNPQIIMIHKYSQIKQSLFQLICGLFESNFEIFCANFPQKILFWFTTDEKNLICICEITNIFFKYWAIKGRRMGVPFLRSKTCRPSLSFWNLRAMCIWKSSLAVSFHEPTIADTALMWEIHEFKSFQTGELKLNVSFKIIA